MKNIIKKASFVTILLLGIACISNAQVTVSFTLHIDDNATPIWTRDYCAQVYVMEGTVQHCVQQLTGLSVDDNLISYDCYLPYSESKQNYQIKCLVWRNESPISHYGPGQSLLIFFNDVTSGLTNVIATIN